MSKHVIGSNNQYIEICELPEEELAGKVKIKMSALKIHESDAEWNENGLVWLENFVQDNLQSIIGSPYVVSWMDEENQIPCDHGEMSYDDEGNVIFDGVAVGTIQDAFIETIEIDGENTKVLMTEGYLFSQRYNNFIKWLKDEIKNENVHGSIEINGKGKNKNIEYLNGSTNPDGSLKIPRIPTVFDFSALAILNNIVLPADKNSIVFEVNSKEGEAKNMKDVINKGAVIEMNKLNYSDIACLITQAFNKAMGVDDYYWGNYEIHKFYPETAEVVFSKWKEAGTYYTTTYKVENSMVTIGEIAKVEEDWTPVSNSQPVEINTEYIKEALANQNGGKQMNEDLNAKITELSSKVTELNTKVTELNSLNVEKDAKIVELNETLVNVNKSLEDANGKYSTIEAECNSLKEEKEKMETEKKQAECNAYFETEIPKNKFEEAEINSLKEYVEKCDLNGLKNAEAELIVKKFKEGKLEVEVNSKTENKGIFFTTKEEKMTVNDVEAGRNMFFGN